MCGRAPGGRIGRAGKYWAGQDGRGERLAGPGPGEYLDTVYPNWKHYRMGWGGLFIFAMVGYSLFIPCYPMSVCIRLDCPSIPAGWSVIYSWSCLIFWALVANLTTKPEYAQCALRLTSRHLDGLWFLARILETNKYSLVTMAGPQVSINFYWS